MIWPEPRGWNGGTMFKFERLDAWKKAVALYQDVVAASDSLPQRDQFSLGDQARRAALSVSTNIAEGTGRPEGKEPRYFFGIAKGSLYETVSLLYVMQHRGYLSADSYRVLYDRCDELAAMLTGLMSIRRNSPRAIR